MNLNERPNSIANGRTRSKTSRLITLNSAVEELLDSRILPQQAIFNSVNGLWNSLLPAELEQHCKIEDVSGGILKVRVDSPPYMHELRLCGPELLKELQKHCPRARIRTIKTFLA